MVTTTLPYPKPKLLHDGWNPERTPVVAPIGERSPTADRDNAFFSPPPHVRIAGFCLGCCTDITSACPAVLRGQEYEASRGLCWTLKRSLCIAS